MTDDQVLALADYLTKRTDLNVGGPGSALVRAVQAVDLAAVDIVHESRSARRQAKRVSDAPPHVCHAWCRPGFHTEIADLH